MHLHRLSYAAPDRRTVTTAAHDSAAERIGRRIVASGCIAVWLISAGVLLGWQFGVVWLVSPVAGTPFTTPIAAVYYLLAAIALWPSMPRRLAQGCAIAVTVLASHLVLATALGLHHHHDMLFAHRLAVPAEQWAPGRSSLSSSVALLLLGLSLLFSGRKIPGSVRRWYWSEFLILPALFAGVLGITGYAFGAHHFVLETLRTLPPLSVNSALCVWLLSFGVLFSNPDHRFSAILLSPEAGGVLARSVLPFATITIFTIGWLVVLVSHSQLFDARVATAVLVTSGAFALGEAVLWTASLLNRDAAEHKSTQQSVAYLSAIVEGSNDAIIGKTLDGIISSWNRAAEKLYGYTDAEVIGRTADILIPSDHRNELAENLRRLAKGEKVPQYETVRRRKDGTIIDVEIALSPIRDAAGNVIGASSIARDITEAKRAEESLRRAEREWEQTFNALPDLIAVLDKQNRVVRVNKALAERRQLTAASCVGMLCYECLHGTHNSPPDCPHLLSLQDGRQHMSEMHEEALGGDFVVSTTPYFDEQGELAGMVHVSRDVSELKTAHQALVRSEKLATTGQMAASIAHEIHNPLDAVGNLLYLIQQSTAEDETRNFVAMAQQELGRVTQITQQMLSFQREAAAPVAVKFQEVLDNVLALYERKITDAGVEIKVEVDPEATILALPGQTRQIIANLIGNAIEARGPQHNKIWIRAYPSREWHGGEEGLRFVIADNGRGIPSELRKKIFDPFFTTKGENGTGLGLWITQGIVEKFGGSIHLRSTTRPGRSGTCFSLFFPNAPRLVSSAPAGMSS